MLLSGRGRTLGIEAGPESAGTVIQSDTGLASVIGRPAAGLIEETARLARTILAEPEHAGAIAASLPGWNPETATLHLLQEPGRLPDAPVGEVRMIEPGELAAIPDLPAALRRELEIEARIGTPTAASFEERRPVAFCYAGAVTETLWDVSIDTLEPFRRRGHAMRCAAFLIRRLARAGLQPVWGAAASNTASERLAAKLSFEPVDSIVVFSSSRDANALIAQVARWAASRDDIRAVALVGSRARGAARPDSDVDLILVCRDPSRYLRDTGWLAGLGSPEQVTAEDWGLVTSLRVRYEDGPEVEFGFAPLEWAATPPPPGTREVLSAGAVVLLDRDGALSGLVRPDGDG